jgi:predicted GIY-YIG superfamily endonuclease
LTKLELAAQLRRAADELEEECEPHREVTVTGMLPKQLEPLRSSLRLTANSYFSDPCLYFLRDAGEVVYVGKTVQFGVRIVAHLDDKRKRFDLLDTLILPVPVEEMSDLEYAFIHLFQAEYNMWDARCRNGMSEHERQLLRAWGVQA